MATLHPTTGAFHPIDTEAEQSAAARVVGVIALLLAIGLALAGVRMVSMNTDPVNDMPALNVQLPDVEPPAAVGGEQMSPRL